MAAAVGAIVFVVALERRRLDAAGNSTTAAAKTAIQGYLDALPNGDDETIARNTLCGLYDAVKDRKSDLALANLSSDAFRKQFASAEVTSIDKIVFWSPNQAQVLFTHAGRPPRRRSSHAARWRSRAWRSCCARTTRSWCARTCCARQASTELS